MSDSEHDEEVPEQQRLEEVTIAGLRGKWQHSSNNYLTVLDDEATFTDGTKYKLTQKGNTVECDGWTAVVGKSSNNRVYWVKGEEEKAYWDFEEDIDAPEGQGAVGADGEPIEVVAVSNIITGKRRRRTVDYEALNRQMEMQKSGRGRGAFDAKSDDDDDDDDDDHEEDEEESKAPPAKKQKATPSPAEVSECAKALNAMLEAVGGKAGVAKCSADDAMAQVAKLENMAMTMDLLRSTKVGKAVNAFRKHSDAKLAERVKALVTGWKGLAQ